MRGENLDEPMRIVDVAREHLKTDPNNDGAQLLCETITAGLSSVNKQKGNGVDQLASYLCAHFYSTRKLYNEYVTTIRFICAVRIQRVRYI